MLGRLKNLFKAPNGETARRVSLPSIVETGVNYLDEWDIVGELGDGAFGKVEKAVSKADSRKVAAAKCISIEEGEELEDFLVEVHILIQCDHPNIIAMHACYYMDNKLSMLLEYCAGGAVDSIMIELEKPLSEPQIAYIARFTCEALAYLHDQNVIHRDLKAGNILLTADATVKLADFGVSAKLKDRNERRDTFIGTPYWMAPEVIACETFKDQPYDVRSDVWSFGITLIEMAQMEPPHAEASAMRVLIKVQKSEPPKLAHPEHWSLFFNDFLSQCLIKNPANRRSSSQLRSHPFVRSGTDKKCVEMLLAEVHADVKEVEIIEDTQSIASESSQEDAQENIPPVDTLESKKQKRAAPPPPAASPVNHVSTTPVTPENDRTLTAHSPQGRKGPASPESTDVFDALRELDTALSSESTFIAISPSSAENNSDSYFSPPPTRKEMIEASNTIKNVLDSVRARSRNRSSSSQEEGKSAAAGVSALRDRFECAPHRSPSLSSSSRHASTDDTDVESAARARIRNAIQQRIDLEANRQQRESEVTVNRPDSTRVAASFEQPRRPVNGDNRSRGEQGPGKDYNYFVDMESSTTSSNEYFGDLSTDDCRPPPDPPVDYEDKRDGRSRQSTIVPPEPSSQAPANGHAKRQPTKEKPVVGNGSKVAPAPAPMRRNPNRRTVTKKTRTYVVDGVEVTSTTMHVLGRQQNLQLRRQEMQEHKRMQREEAKQLQELEAQAAHQNEMQERKQQQEKMTMGRQYEIDMDTLTRKQKREIEDIERLQEEELRTTTKRLKYDQEKDMQAFRERLKQEMKIMKQEVDMLPRPQRKEALRVRKEAMEEGNAMKEQDFMMQLRMNAEATIARMRAKHKEKISTKERQFLEQKHMLLRAREGSEWELEEKVMGERYVLHRRLLKDRFYLLRTQMLARQQKEQQQAGKLYQKDEEDLVRALAADRKRLPKMLRSEAKARALMFKESMRISHIEPGVLSEKLRDFEENERMRYEKALKDHDMKSEKKIAALKEKNAAEMAELEEAQGENRKILLEKERQTLQEHENKFVTMRDDWKNELPEKKLKLETIFEQELAAQEHFYGLQSSTPSTPSLSRS